MSIHFPQLISFFVLASCMSDFVLVRRNELYAKSLLLMIVKSSQLPRKRAFYLIHDLSPLSCWAYSSNFFEKDGKICCI